MALRRTRVALLAAGFAAMSLQTSVMEAQTPVQAPHLRPLKSVDELRSWFNANRAHPRLIFLLSPT